jgi:hypothetical protein
VHVPGDRWSIRMTRIGVNTPPEGSQRRGLASFNIRTGKLNVWGPRVFDPALPPRSGAVSDLDISGDTVFLAGSFAHVGGKRRFSLAFVHQRTGKVTGWNPRPDQNRHADSADGVVAGIGSVLQTSKTGAR